MSAIYTLFAASAYLFTSATSCVVSPTAFGGLWGVGELLRRFYSVSSIRASEKAPSPTFVNKASEPKKTLTLLTRYSQDTPLTYRPRKHRSFQA